MRDRRDIDDRDSTVTAMYGAEAAAWPPVAAGVLAWAFATRVLSWENDLWLWLFVGCAVIATICAEIAFLAWLHEKDTAPRKKFFKH